MVLSACNTAGADGSARGGQALSGLVRAFLYAGSRAVLATHWDIASEPTVQLTSRKRKENLPEVVYVRDFADSLYSKVCKGANFAILGNAGIGKSWFQWYLIHKLVRAHVTRQHGADNEMKDAPPRDPGLRDWNKVPPKVIIRQVGKKLPEGSRLGRLG